MNYFKSYYLDYPYMDMENFLQFFKTNSKLCEEVLGDDTFNDSLKLMLYLQNLEENVKKDKFSPNLFLSKDARKIINAQIKCIFFHKICKIYFTILTNLLYRNFIMRTFRLIKAIV